MKNATNVMKSRYKLIENEQGNWEAHNLCGIVMTCSTRKHLLNNLKIYDKVSPLCQVRVKGNKFQKIRRNAQYRIYL